MACTTCRNETKIYRNIGTYGKVVRVCSKWKCFGRKISRIVANTQANVMQVLTSRHTSSSEPHLQSVINALSWPRTTPTKPRNIVKTKHEHVIKKMPDWIVWHDRSAPGIKTYLHNGTSINMHFRLPTIVTSVKICFRCGYVDALEITTRVHKHPGHCALMCIICVEYQMSDAFIAPSYIAVKHIALDAYYLSVNLLFFGRRIGKYL